MSDEKKNIVTTESILGTDAYTRAMNRLCENIKTGIVKVKFGPSSPDQLTLWDWMSKSDQARLHEIWGRARRKKDYADDQARKNNKGEQE